MSRERTLLVPKLLAFLTRLQESRMGCDPSRRANARRERVPARRLRIETPFGLRVCFNLWFHLPASRPADAPYPYQTVGPDPHKLVETVTRTAASPSSTTDCQSIVCHAVEAHRFPGHRPFIPEVHPASPRRGEGRSLSSSGARVRGNHAVSSPSSSFASCSVSTGAGGGPIRPSRF